MKTRIIILILFIVSLFSCDTNNEHEDDYQTVMVTFFNTSSYKVIVHRDSFYGPIIGEVNNTSRETKIPVRIIDNKVVVFSFEYIITLVNDDSNNETGDITVSCYDPDIQFPVELKPNNPITIQIPQPANLVCKSAFINIINSHNLSVRLRYSTSSINQANNTLLIEPYRQGLYKFDDIPDIGEHCQNYNMSTAFDEIYFSDFITQNGEYLTKNAYIYYFTYNGTSIVKENERILIFN
ncbi:MAG: hypothetical protein FWB86_11360 [Treponema sp.]|nr:hypothetical protein [Treponema sp.]MCL2252151.1 hypothetical protein [Treponema sp.]